ncbi:4'-phosphopantetheinyl transferase family protein [Candidatus Endolissoclinum faulkneri]|uniref:4'-phosphopantetheinyl transferase family protein n=1 Tax=Candidatus Endolissoclinum faulkneri TaxID=1263979 RepID=UPI00130DF2F1|nr:4'-phosphopantetheinyl transferase superfamily protein [Candidatus Endolissoclinum faulkneri]
MLDTFELQQASRRIFEAGRIEYIVAHAMVRSVLANELGVDPRDFRFVRGRYGKPTALLGGTKAAISFNLSHTKGMVVVGIAPKNIDLGVDVENKLRKIDLSIANHYFAPSELAWIMAQSASDQASAFMALWTLKEAFIKATGKGLSQKLNQFWFTDPFITPIRINFGATMRESSCLWGFEQRILLNKYYISIGWHGLGHVNWIEIA